MPATRAMTSIFSRLFNGAAASTTTDPRAKWRNASIAVVAAVGISLGFLLLNRGTLPNSVEAYADLAFGIAIGLSLWLSMSTLNAWLAPRLDWFDRPFRALFVVLVANTLVAIATLMVVRAAFLVGY